MAMAMARSALARVARGRHSASQPLLPARAAPERSPSPPRWMLARVPTADSLGKRFLSSGVKDTATQPESELLQRSRKNYFKVDGYYQLDTSVYLLLDTYNGIDNLSRAVMKFNHKEFPLIMVALLVSGLSLGYYSFHLSRRLKEKETEAACHNDIIKNSLNTLTSAGLTTTPHGFFLSGDD